MIDFDECWTLTMKFGTTEKTMTSNDKTVFWKSFIVLCESVETTLLSAYWIMGWEIIAAEKEHSKQLTQTTMK